MLRVQIDNELGKSDRRLFKPDRAVAGDFLQAVGIGSLMPLAGFILLIFGETAFSLYRYKFSGKTEETDGIARPPRREILLSRHAGLGCAFVSMLIFSITLSDRLADFLFAGTALVTLLASFRRSSAAA